MTVTTEHGSVTDSASKAMPVLDVEELVRLRQKLMDAVEAVDQLQKMIESQKSSDVDRPRSRRRLGRLAGKVHLSVEQALAPMDEEELKAWGL